MRHLIALPVIAATLAMGGCESLTAISGGHAPTVAEIQADAQSTCGYLPTAETVTDMVTKANAQAAAGYVLGSTIANIICGAVTSKSASRDGRHMPMAYGVAIHGRFVR